MQGSLILRKAIKSALRDLLGLRNVESYIAAFVASVLAALSIVGDVVADNIKWAALFAGLAILVYRSAVPARRGAGFEDIAGDRSAFAKKPLSERWQNAREIWIFAPSAVNILSQEHCDILRKQVLARSGAVVRVVILNPADEGSVRDAVRQLDDSLDYPVQEFRQSLAASVRHLEMMVNWQLPGSLEYRYAPYNPGFSLVATDPSSRSGSIIVEFHAFHNETTTSRMHLELTRQTSELWFTYWANQFDHIWQAARPPHGSDNRRVG
jgi:hypothetical protein